MWAAVIHWCHLLCDRPRGSPGAWRPPSPQLSECRLAVGSWPPSTTLPHSPRASRAGLRAHSELTPVPGHLPFPLPGVPLLVRLFFIMLVLVQCHFLRCLPWPTGVRSSPFPGTVPGAQNLPGSLGEGLRWTWLGHWGGVRDGPAGQFESRRKKASNAVPGRPCTSVLRSIRTSVPREGLTQPPCLWAGGQLLYMLE